MTKRFSEMSPARRRMYVFNNVIIAILTTWFAVSVARDPGSEAGRILLASVGAAIFIGMASFGVWALWREERSPSASS